MMRFFLDKFKESTGPLKETRQLVGDVLEEIMDIVEHYIKGSRDNVAEALEDVSEPRKSHDQQGGDNPTVDSAPDKKEKLKKKKQLKKPEPKRTLEVPEELAAALDMASNRKRQEFKVLAILWDANNRNLGNLSAKKLSEHGEKLGLAIRHENVRKVIRMRLQNNVEILQNRRQGTSIYNYRITDKGIEYFSTKYLIF